MATVACRFVLGEQAMLLRFDLWSRRLWSDVREQRLPPGSDAITGNTALIESAVAVQQATAELLRVTAGHLAKSLPKDAALATDPTANPDDRKAAAFRWAGRFLRIGAWCVGASVGATYALGQTIVLAKDVLEALPIIQASPYYQQALAAVLRLLNLG